MCLVWVPDTVNCVNPSHRTSTDENSRLSITLLQRVLAQTGRVCDHGTAVTMINGPFLHSWIWFCCVTVLELTLHEMLGKIVSSP
ncbi:hypothetical protein GDO81_028909 [Engystomops pustulosus]|uniref:Uncharacterized protein n=1 Tax=Engystomops pustulosus TaxID=76066 RepID=A0AAV6ZFX5_ENGPU|nr:hypothetical protein GDO81_028909 [Engystomops pustulosus]